MRALPDDTIWAAKAPPNPDAADAGERMIRYELGYSRASGDYWLSISNAIGRNSALTAALTEFYRISRADAERLAD